MTTPTSSLAVEHRDAAVLGVEHELPQLGERRLLGAGDRVPLMIPLTGAWESPWPIALSRSSRLTDPARRSSSTTNMPLWPCRWQSAIVRATCSSGGTDRAGRRHDVPGAQRLARRLREGRERASPRLVERLADDRGGRIGMPAAAESPRRLLRRRRLGPAAHDAEDPILHLDEEQQRTRVGEVDELVREVRDPVDVLGPRDRRDEHLASPAATGSRASERALQELALGRRERQVQVLAEQILPGAVTEAPGQRVDVALRRRRVRERARVLVDAERESGRLGRGRHELALGQDADHRRRQRAVVRLRPPWPRPPSPRARRRGGRRRSSRRSDRAPPARARRAARRATVSTTISRRIASSSRREASTRPSSSACSRANSRTLRLTVPASATVASG